MSATSCYFHGIEFKQGQTEKIEDHLLAHPDVLPDFHEAVMQSLRNVIAWGDYKSAPEIFELMCLVSANVRLALGEHVLEPAKTQAKNS